jgi:hypothetical protein
MITTYRGRALLSVDGLAGMPCTIDLDSGTVRAWPVNWTKALHAVSLPAEASLRMPTGAVLPVLIEDRAAFHGLLYLRVTEPAGAAETREEPRPRAAE